jgi:serine protease Do
MVPPVAILLFFLLGPAIPAYSAPEVTSAIIEVAKKNIPAVAHVEVTERKEVPNPLLPFQTDPFFRHFFGNRKPPKDLKQEVRGLGSGMIMDTKGNILTSYHVVGGATKIEVQLSSGSRYTAKVVGGDPKTDIAVIHIEAKETLPIVSFGDSDKLEVGEWVVAIGHPRGLDQTVTQGIVSAKHRQGILDPTSYQDFLQTDAPINPGNSGGPLFNLRGEVVGINTAIATESGGSEGIGFAVPSNIAIHIAKTLIAHGKVERGWLGVSIEQITPEKARSLKIPEGTKGTIVAEITKGSPAERAGIQKNDVITAYNGKPIPDPVSLQNAVSMSAIGSQVKVTVQRDGKRLDIPVKIGDMNEQEKILTAEAKQRLGAEFRDMSEKEASTLGLESPQGAVISTIEPKGPLASAGFEKGDVILQIEGQTVSNAAALAQLVAMIPPGRQVSVLAADPKKKSAGAIKVTVK